MSDLKHQELPLARIKKIMKLDDDVKVMYIVRHTGISRVPELEPVS